MDVSAIALQGLDLAQTQLERAATRLASAGALSPDAANVDSVDLSAEMVGLLAAKNQFSVNLKTLKIGGEIQQNLIDLMA
jgi:flagellar hook protein FlgE